MKVQLFQISPEEDRHNLMFMNYEFTTKHGGIHEGTYELVFDGDLDVKRPEDMFYIFNCQLPEGYYISTLFARYCDRPDLQPRGSYNLRYRVRGYKNNDVAS